MIESLNDCRLHFQVGFLLGEPRKLERRSDGRYLDPTVQYLWEAYTHAWQVQEARLSHKENTP